MIGKIAICDDEKYALDLIAGALEGQLNGAGFHPSVHKFSNALELKEALSKEVFDCLFLDIEMPFLDGIELARFAKSQSSDMHIVFVSNRIDKVFDTFEVKPFAFVRKTRLLEDLSACVSRLLSEEEKGDTSSIVLKHKSGFIKVKLDDILYVECNQNLQTVVCIDGSKVDTYIRMKELEETLVPNYFYRAQRSYLVNLKHVKEINGTSLVMSNGFGITIRRGSYSDIKLKLLECLQNNNILIK